MLQRWCDKCKFILGFYYKITDRTEDITGLVGLAWVLTARNGANGEMTARICADVVGEKE